MATRAKSKISGSPPKKKRPPRAEKEALSAGSLQNQLNAVREIGAALANTVGLDALFEKIVPQISHLMDAERTTLFLYDTLNEEIWSRVAEGAGVREIRLPLGHGIAGWVARQHQTITIADAYKDDRFDASVDARTGFRTRSVAATPLLDRQGQLLGVLQVLNHQGGPFSPDDVGLLRAIAAQTAYAVENARLSQHILDQNRELEAAHLRAERRRAELDLLYQLEQESSASSDLDQLLDSIIVRTCERLRSAAGSVLLLDKDTGKLYFRGISGEQKNELRKTNLDPNQGVVGWVAQNGQGVIVNRPEEDPRYAADLAKKLDYPASAVLAVPLIWDRRIIGAVEVLNPQSRPNGATGYDLEDLKVLTVIAGQVARAVSLTIERQARMETERLATVGQMLAGVAHDLRNPMTVISGYAQLMVGEDEGQERQVRCERILSQIDEMTGMIADLLAFARGDSRLRPAIIELPAFAHELHENLAMQCDRREITLNIQAQPGHLCIDVGRTKRIVHNLARNAIEALTRGGALTISLSGENSALSLRVEDNGPGIPEEMQNRLFTPFATAGKSGGTGLGLAIVKRFVDDHHGQIAVDSAKGRGTIFSVHLPIIDSAMGVIT